MSFFVSHLVIAALRGRLAVLRWAFPVCVLGLTGCTLLQPPSVIGRPDTYSSPDRGCELRPATKITEPYDTALCIARERSPWEAAVYLQSIARAQPDGGLQPRASKRLMAALYQRVGLIDKAASLAQSLRTGSAANSRPAVAPGFRLQQARAWLNLGEPAKAEAVLQTPHVRTRSDSLKEERAILLALALMQQGEHSKAVETLEANRGFPKRNLVGHYNYAVALVQAGRVKEGLALLDEVGTAKVGNGIDARIQDRANLQLGWMWLRQEQGGTARAILQRVRLHGPYSDRGLLGLGWAAVADDGKPQKISFRRKLSCSDIQAPPDYAEIWSYYIRSAYADCEDPRLFRMFHLFAFAAGAKSEQRWVNALKYWLELKSRDAAEPAVQEALLAIAYAYRRLGDNQRATEAYLEAAAKLKQVIASVESAINALKSRHGTPLDIIRFDKYARLFSVLRSRNGFHQLAEQQRELETLHARLSNVQSTIRRLDRRSKAPVSTLQEMQARSSRLLTDLRAHENRLQARIRNAGLRWLARQIQDLRNYRKNAILGMLSLRTASDAATGQKE